MTTPTLREAAQQALEALEAMKKPTPTLSGTMKLQARAAKKLRAALAEPDHKDLLIAQLEETNLWQAKRIAELLAEPQGFATKEFRLLDAVDVEATDGDYVHLPKGASVWSKPHAAPQPKAEPVACIGMIDEEHFVEVCRKAGGNSNTLLYAAPQPNAEPQEPFGYLWPTGTHPEFRFTQQERDGADGMPVYTAPQPRRRLTDEEKREMWTNATVNPCTHMHCYLRGIEDAEDAIWSKT